MKKVVLTENELRQLIYQSANKILTNEGFGGALSGLWDMTSSPVSSLLNGRATDTRRPMAHGAAKIYNAFQKDPNKKLSANDFIWGEKGSKNGERGKKYNGKKDHKTAEHEIKQYGYGKPVIENNELAVYDENSASKISFIGDTKVLVGHCIGEDDRFENSGGLSKHYRTLANGNPKDINRGMKTWLSNRDECFRATTKLEKSSGVKEIEFEEGTELEEGIGGLIRGASKLAKPLLKTGGRIAAGGAVANAGAKMVKNGKISQIQGAIRGNGKSNKGIFRNLMRNSGELDMNKIENEVLPLVLQSLCASLSIEQEDPMYQLIMSKATKKNIIRRLEQSL